MSNLGITVKDKSIVARLWAPTAEAVTIHIYSSDNREELPTVSFSLAKTEEKQGAIWGTSIESRYENMFYTFQIKEHGTWLKETPDPEVKTTGVNGERGMIINLNKTNPEGWELDKGPKLHSTTDAIIYEAHVRDFSVSETSGSKYRGKYMAFTETGSKSPNGLATGISHLLELGITHLHLLPIADFFTVDEIAPLLPSKELRRDGKPYADSNYNWGYDPQHYSSLEGSYATDPHDGRVRVKEAKSMVQSLHNNGIAVVLDVVYNHTGLITLSSFNLTAPHRYYRHLDNGEFSNASGCGTEVASEIDEVREYIISSLLYWAEEYHIDGFRFDLMGILDIETMNIISEKLHKLNPNTILYGEGWCADYSPLPDHLRATKQNTFKLDRIASFCDDFRDAIKGDNFHDSSRGFINGTIFKEEQLKFGIVGAIEHKGVDYNHINSSNGAWSISPKQCINYLSCHDNYTLFDKLLAADPHLSIEELKKEVKLGMALLLTSQGIPLIHAGSEFLRTKKGEHNSYNLPDSINAIDWSQKEQHYDIVQFVKELIILRKERAEFRMTSGDDVRQSLSFIGEYAPGVINYRLTSSKEIGDDILLLFNGNKHNVSLNIPQGRWQPIFNLDGRVTTQSTTTTSTPTVSTAIELEPTSFQIMVKIAEIKTS